LIEEREEEDWETEEDEDCDVSTGVEEVVTTEVIMPDSLKLPLLN